MFKLLFFFCAFFLSISSHAQKNNNYFSTIAGDTALSSNKKLTKADLGDTVTIDLYKGLFRIVLNEGLTVNENIDIQVFTEQGQKIELKQNADYIEFFNSASRNVRFISTAKNTIEKDVIAEIFWVYNKNTLTEAPQFHLKDIEGNEYTNESVKGKIVVINFWGIWCRPCMREIPQLNRLVKQYEDRDDILFIALSADPVDKLNEFVKKTRFTYKLISDKKATTFQTKFINLGMITFPSHVILDKNGNVVLQYLGEHPNIEQLLTSFIEKQK